MAKSLEKISDLTPDPRNVNKGTLAGVKVVEDSLQAFGAGRSILADKNGVVIAGNKTLECSVSVGMDKIHVVQTTGDELIVVQRIDLDLMQDAKARGLALSDNRGSEVGYAPDEALLAEFLTELAESDQAARDAAGYDEAATGKLLARLADEEKQ